MASGLISFLTRLNLRLAAKERRAAIDLLRSEPYVICSGLEVRPPRTHSRRQRAAVVQSSNSTSRDFVGAGKAGA